MGLPGAGSRSEAAPSALQSRQSEVATQPSTSTGSEPRWARQSGSFSPGGARAGATGGRRAHSRAEGAHVGGESAPEGHGRGWDSWVVKSEQKNWDGSSQNPLRSDVPTHGWGRAREHSSGSSTGEHAVAAEWRSRDPRGAQVEPGQTDQRISRQRADIRVGKLTADDAFAGLPESSILALHKPTNMPLGLDVIEHVTTRDSLSPCLENPLSDDEIRRLWNSTRQRARRGGRSRWADSEGKPVGPDPKRSSSGSEAHALTDMYGTSQTDKDRETFEDADGGDEDSWETFARQANEFAALKATVIRGHPSPGHIATQGLGSGSASLGEIEAAPGAPTIESEAPTSRHSEAARDTSTELSPEYDPNTAVWYYQDPHGRVQGGFRSMEMREWMLAGFFSQHLPVRLGAVGGFVALAEAYPDSEHAFVAAPLVRTGAAPHSRDQVDVINSVVAGSTPVELPPAPLDDRTVEGGELPRLTELKLQLEELIRRESQALAIARSGGDSASAERSWLHVRDLQQYHKDVTAQLNAEAGPGADSPTHTAGGTTTPQSISGTPSVAASHARPAWVRQPVASGESQVPVAASRGDGTSPPTTESQGLQQMGSQIKALLGVGEESVDEVTAGTQVVPDIPDVSTSRSAKFGAGGNKKASAVVGAGLPEVVDAAATPQHTEPQSSKPVAEGEAAPSGGPAWKTVVSAPPSARQISDESVAVTGRDTSRPARPVSKAAQPSAWAVATPPPVTSLRGIQEEEAARAIAAPAVVTAASVAAAGVWGSSVVSRRDAGARARMVDSHPVERSSGGSLFGDSKDSGGDAARERDSEPVASVSERRRIQEERPARESNAFGGSGMSDDLMRWCADEMLRLIGSSDTTLMQFCMTLESAADIREYIREYMGSTPQVSAFASEFIKRRRAATASGPPNSGASGTKTAMTKTAVGSKTQGGRRKRGKRRG